MISLNDKIINSLNFDTLLDVKFFISLTKKNLEYNFKIYFTEINNFIGYDTP